jgi:hypothetical protein
LIVAVTSTASAGLVAPRNANDVIYIEAHGAIVKVSV